MSGFHVGFGGATRERVMRVALALLVALAATPAVAGDIDPAVSAAFVNWGLPVPSSAGLVFCHGYNCNFRTQIGLSGADHARLAALMEPGRASADAERRAVAKTRRGSRSGWRRRPAHSMPRREPASAGA